jgi:transposase InsO family protein
VRTADQPGEAVNIDICFVPIEHLAQENLPAVSGSSGRLVFCHHPPGMGERTYPGQVFGQAELTYEEAMQAYIAATRDRVTPKRSAHPTAEEQPSAWRQEHERQDVWYRIQQRRQQEDQVWQTAKVAHRQAVQAFHALTRKERQPLRTTFRQQQEQWVQVRRERQQSLVDRKAETTAWHERNRLAKQTDLTGCAHPWFAILVVTDNCTRQCMALPVFESGAHLTSQELVQALAACLPEHLAYLISDQDFKFRSQALAQLAQQRGFVQVPIFRHHPQTNGIAERFVWSLKDWLEAHAWASLQQLSHWLAVFRPEYNDRPHQGLPIPGLSPNEFANRIFLF